MHEHLEPTPWPPVQRRSQSLVVVVAIGAALAVGTIVAATSRAPISTAVTTGLVIAAIIVTGGVIGSLVWGKGGVVDRRERSTTHRLLELVGEPTELYWVSAAPMLAAALTEVTANEIAPFGRGLILAAGSRGVAFAATRGPQAEPVMVDARHVLGVGIRRPTVPRFTGAERSATRLLLKLQSAGRQVDGIWRAGDPVTIGLRILGPRDSQGREVADHAIVADIADDVRRVLPRARL